MPKLYMMEFTDKVTAKKFYKFGWTQHKDAVKRFSNPVYEDFEVKCIASLFHPSEQVILALEMLFLSLFPKNIWLEEYLGDARTWDDFSGITEIVNLSNEDYKRAVQLFYNVKGKLNGQ